MALAPRHRCAEAGCKAIIRGVARCPKHATPNRSPSAKKDQWCSNKKWRKLRAAYIAANPLCVHCSEQGRIKAAEHVHHIAARQDAMELAYSWENLMSLCRVCHSVETAKEYARRERGQAITEVK